MSNVKRNLESGGLYVNRWITGEVSQRSPLFVPMSAMGVSMLNRYDTLWDGLNVEISHNATLERRPGFPKYSTQAFGGSDYPLAFYSFKNTSGTIKAMVDTPTKVCWFDTTSITTIFSKSGSAQTSFQKVGDTVYMCNGTDADLKKWNQTTATKWGIATPVLAPSISLSSGTLSPLSGYQYVYVFKNSSTGHVSTASPVSASTGALTNKTVTLGGSYSTDAQVDKIEIYRNRDGGALFYFLAEVNNTNGWSYSDTIADIGLNDFIVAPLANSNDAPPTGMSLCKFHQGRMWGAVKNILYFGAGPDCTNGVPEEAWPPANNFKLADNITAIVSTSQGLVVFTTSDAYVVLGSDILTYVPIKWQPNFGVLQQNAVAQDGDLVFIFTSQAQLYQLPDVSENGFPIQLKLGAYNPATVYLAVHRSGADEGLFISDGSTDIRRYSVAMQCWSPLAQPVGGVKCIASIETTTANYRLLMGRTAGSGYILNRSRSTFTDESTNYSAYAVVGSLILAPPRQTALVQSIVLETTSTGTFPTIQVLLNEISGTFTTLPNPVPDPPELIASTTVRMMRHDIKAAQTPLPQHVRHMQVKIVFATEAAHNEVLGMGVV